MSAAQFPTTPFLPTAKPGTKGDAFSLWYLSPGLRGNATTDGEPVYPEETFGGSTQTSVPANWNADSSPVANLPTSAWSTAALYGKNQSDRNGTSSTGDVVNPRMLTFNPLQDGYGAGFARPVSSAGVLFSGNQDEEFHPLELALLASGFKGAFFPGLPYVRTHRQNLNFGLAVTQIGTAVGILIPVWGQYTVVTVSSGAPPVPIPPDTGAAPPVLPTVTDAPQVVIFYQGQPIWHIPVDLTKIVIDTSTATIVFAASYESLTATAKPPHPFPDPTAYIFDTYNTVDNGPIHVFYVTLYTYTGHVLVPFTDILEAPPGWVPPGTPLGYGTTLQDPFPSPPNWNDFSGSVAFDHVDAENFPAPPPVGLIPNSTPIALGEDELTSDEVLPVTAVGATAWQEVDTPAWTSGSVLTNPGDIGLPVNGMAVPAGPTSPNAILIFPPAYMFYQCSF